jgi:hypothetical protein
MLIVVFKSPDHASHLFCSYLLEKVKKYMWKHPYHRSNQEFGGWNLMLPQTAVLSCHANGIAIAIAIVNKSKLQPVQRRFLSNQDKGTFMQIKKEDFF